ncbi:unnamed protein product, partial [Rotaria sp. Silwood1]
MTNEEKCKQKKCQPVSSDNWFKRYFCDDFNLCCCLWLSNKNNSDSNGDVCCSSDDSGNKCDCDGCDCGGCDCGGCD